MANSNDTKEAIQRKIERLANQRRDLRKQITPLKDKLDRFKARVDEINLAIQRLEADLNG